MSIRFACSACGHIMNVADEVGGKRVRCPQCQAVVVVPAAAAVGAAEAGPASPGGMPAMPAASPMAAGPAPMAGRPASAVSPGITPPASDPVMPYAASRIARDEPPRAFMPRAVDAMLDGLRPALSDGLYRMGGTLGMLIGELMLFIAVFVHLVYTSIASIKNDALSQLAASWGMGLGILIVGYVALKVIPGSLSLMRSSATRVGSSTWLDCFAVLALAGILVALGAPFVTIRSSPWPEIVDAFVTYWVAIPFLLVVAVVALNPRLVFVRVEQGVGAGEELLGLISFVAKAAVACLPPLLAVLATRACVLQLVAFVALLRAWGSNAGFVERMQAGEAVATARTSLTVLVVTPIAIALYFLVYHLVVDLCRAILAIPSLKPGGKSDKQDAP